ncbi:MAG: alcohol dehydrogenase catalytic domain-containing protein [bacterium]|nr:alcohol dehydrogenase catalytic domain-containing protein [bacterium]
MRAIKWNDSDGELKICTTPKPKLSKKNNILIKVRYCGICGTDIHIVNKEFSAKNGIILGHEFTGDIIKIGEDVTTVNVGDRVVVNPNEGCGKCHFCQRGCPHFCLTGGMNNTIGIYRDGGWAEYCAVPESQVLLLPKKISYVQGVLCEPLFCIAHGWELLGKVPDDSNILIIGAGIIGLLWAKMLHHYGFRQVVISETTKLRIKAAKDLFNDFHCMKDDELITFFKGKNPVIDGFDFIIDCSGNPSGIQNSINYIKRGGTLNIFGLCPIGSKIHIDPSLVCLNELKIVGTLINPFTSPRAIGLLENMAYKNINLNDMGIKTFKLKEYKKALTAVNEKRITKAVFDLNK